MSVLNARTGKMINTQCLDCNDFFPYCENQETTNDEIINKPQ